MMKLLLLQLCISNALKNEIILTPRQLKYEEFLMNDKFNLVIATGIAGTGKTWLACKSAINKLVANEIDKIVLTRPTVSVENEELGFLPGELNEKMKPWMYPLMDMLDKENEKSTIIQLIHAGKIELIPLGFMRGRTFDNCCIIADEMQNSSPSQMKMLLTRIGEKSKLIITGDCSQCDLDNRYYDNGLNDIMNLLSNTYDLPHKMYKDNICIIKMEDKDIKRSKFVSTIIKIYNNSEN